MEKKKVVASSLKNSFRNIANNKFLFVIVFLTQILFVILLSFVFTYYAINIGQYAKTILEPLQESGLEQGDITSLYKDPVAIMDAYDSMISNILMFFLSVYLLYIVLNGINWDITDNIVYKDIRFLHYQAYFAILSVIFTIPAVIVINIISNIFLNIQAVAAVIIIGFVILLIALYHMYISFSLISKYKIKEIGPLLKETFVLGYQNFWTLLPTYIIMIIVSIAPIFLMYLTIERNAFLLFGSVILFILCIVWSRLYFLTTMKEIRS